MYKVKSLILMGGFPIVSDIVVCYRVQWQKCDVYKRDLFSEVSGESIHKCLEKLLAEYSSC